MSPRPAPPPPRAPATAATPRKRTPAPTPPRRVQWVIAPQAPLPPMLTAEQVAALDAADLARAARRKPHRPRPPRQCTVGRACVSAVNTAPVPVVRLQGYWLERLGFAIGSQLRIDVCQGVMVLTVLADASHGAAAATAPAARMRGAGRQATGGGGRGVRS